MLYSEGDLLEVTRAELRASAGDNTIDQKLVITLNASNVDGSDASSKIRSITVLQPGSKYQSGDTLMISGAAIPGRSTGSVTLVLRPDSIDGTCDHNTFLRNQNESYPTINYTKLVPEGGIEIVLSDTSSIPPGTFVAFETYVTNPSVSIRWLNAIVTLYDSTGVVSLQSKNVYHTQTRLPIEDAEITLYDRTILSQTDATVKFSIPYSFDFNNNGCIIVEFPEEYNSASSVTGVTVLEPLLNSTRIHGSGRTVSWCIQSPGISLSPETMLKFEIHGIVNPDIHGTQSNSRVYLADSEFEVLTKQIEGVTFPALSTQMTQSMTRFHDYSITSGKNVKATVSMVLSVTVPRSGKVEIVFSMGIGALKMRVLT